MDTSMKARAGGDRLLREASPDDWVSLYNMLVPRAVRLAYLMTSDLGFAEDVVHEAFLRVAARRGALREPHAIEAYMRRAVVNEVLGKRRAFIRRTRREHDAARREVPPGADALGMQQADDRIDLLQGMTALTTKQRTMILLKYWMDLSDPQIAETMGCPVGTVKSTLSRALDALRRTIGDV